MDNRKNVILSLATIAAAIITYRAVMFLSKGLHTVFVEWHFLSSHGRLGELPAFLGTLFPGMFWGLLSVAAWSLFFAIKKQKVGYRQ